MEIYKDSFLLTTPMAKKLYNNCAKKLPVIDYHNHLSVDDLIKDRKFNNLYELWLESDPYKHRAMRICGIPEKYITGKATGYEKFEKWCEIFPSLVGNALFDWSLMELDRVFGIKDIPSPKTCKKIWDKANEKLSKDGFSVQAILKKFNVEYIAPCVALTDDVKSLKEKANCSFSVRCDDFLSIKKDVFEKLATVTKTEIVDLDNLKTALTKRIKSLKKNGLNFADHSLDNGFLYIKDDGKNDKRFKELLKEKELKEEDKNALICELLRILGGIYAKNKIVMQLHMGAQRTTSSRLRAVAGPAGGYAGIGNSVDSKSVVEFLNDLEEAAGLPKTLLFCLNPVDNALLSILSGSFSKDGVDAIVSEGPAWWWCDHMQGMLSMLDHYSSFSVLSTFIGMTTDSRSVLSFSRHEYFRRVLCMWIGEKVEKGIFPNDYELLKGVVEKICYYNSKKVVEG